MKVLVYPPAGPEDMGALGERVADVYAQAVLRHIRKLSCPDEQKLQLVKAIASSKQGKT